MHISASLHGVFLSLNSAEIDRSGKSKNDEETPCLTQSASPMVYRKKRQMRQVTDPSPEVKLTTDSVFLAIEILLQRRAVFRPLLPHFEIRRVIV